MSNIGYAWIQDAVGAPDFLGAQRARLASVTRIERQPDGSLLVPHKLAPAPSLGQQALFALKHEGVHLALLLTALQRMPAQELADLVLAAPNSVYGRKLGHLWERWHGQRLPGLDGFSVASAYAPLFDPEQYFVGPARRDARWRIEFNGLGELDFCPVVRKTPALMARVQRDVLVQAQAFAADVGPELLERAMTWAYLSETEGSFAIEGEAPTHDKATLFAALLRRAHEQRPLTEDLLVELQNAVISNPFDKAAQFRTEQNRLQRDVPGAAGVTYVPPAPKLAVALMDGLMRLANQRPPTLDALVHAAVVSFAFVFIHPFMDGNGRLSRLPYLDSADILEVNPDITKFVLSLTPEEQKDYHVEPDWILIPCSGQVYGNIGHSVLATEWHVGKVHTNHLMRVAANASIRPGYLQCVLGHPELGRPRLVRYAFGSSVPEISPADVAMSAVPRLDKTIEDELAELMEASAKRRDEADELEQTIGEEAEVLIDEFLAGDETRFVRV